MSEQLTKIKEALASEITARYTIEEEAQGVLQPDMTPSDYILACLKRGQNNEAATFVAHALPKRECIWWGCVSAREGLASQTEVPFYKESLECAEKWVQTPTEENRRVAEEFVKKTDHKHAASWAAQSVFWCTGSICPPDQPAVPAADYLYSKAVAGAVMLAATHVDAENYNQVLQGFIKTGIDLAKA